MLLLLHRRPVGRKVVGVPCLQQGQMSKAILASQDELSKGLVIWNLGVRKNLKSVRLRKGVVRHVA